MSNLETNVARLRAGKQRGREQLFGEIAELIRSDDYLTLIGSCGLLGNYTLEEAMLVATTEGKIDACIELIGRTCDLLKDSLIPALEAHKGFLARNPDRQIFDPISVDALWYPMCLFSLRDEVSSAKELAAWAYSSPPLMNNNRPESEFTLLFSAVLRSDVAAFEKAFRAIEDWPHDSTSLYVELGDFAQTIIEQDKVGFERLCSTIDARFTKRTRISDAEIYAASFGINGYNGVYFDYVTLALLKIAQFQGMAVSVDAISIPKNLL